MPIFSPAAIWRVYARADDADAAGAMLLLLYIRRRHCCRLRLLRFFMPRRHDIDAAATTLYAATPSYATPPCLPGCRRITCYATLFTCRYARHTRAMLLLY